MPNLGERTREQPGNTRGKTFAGVVGGDMRRSHVMNLRFFPPTEDNGRVVVKRPEGAAEGSGRARNFSLEAKIILHVYFYFYMA